MVTSFFQILKYEESVFGHPRDFHANKFTFTFVLITGIALGRKKGPVTRVSCILYMYIIKNMIVYPFIHMKFIGNCSPNNDIN